MKLHQAFNVVRGDVIAFTGAGGKTSALVGLGYELMEQGWRVLVTTTSRIDAEQLQLFPATLPYHASFAAISATLTEHQMVFLYGDIRGDDVSGPETGWIHQLMDNVDSDVLLIEADSANGLPLKAPLQDEPRIPDETSLVIPVSSLAVLDQPLDDDHVYNPQAMTDKYGFYPGSPVRAPWIAQVMRDEEMGLKGIPARSRIVAFLNQTPETGYMRSRARLIARLALKSKRLNGVALGSVRATEPVCEVQRAIGAVILAGGMSSRMGQPKVLLPWMDGRTIIEHIIEQLLRSRLSQITVVTGYYSREVKRTVKPMEVKVVHNRSHKTGEMLSSLQAGLRSMPDNISAVLVVLGDQPRLQPRVIYDVIRAYSEGEGNLIIPSFQMRRGHPILIDRRYWQDILSLGHNGTLRDVIDAASDEIVYVNVNTDSVLRDVDTPSDYEAERRKAGLRYVDIRNLKFDV